MNFFNLQISAGQRGVIYQSDIELRSFETFAHVLASELVKREFFKDRESFALRVVPRWTGQPILDRPAFPDAQSLAPLSSPFIDVIYEEPIQPDPISHLILRWHSRDRPLVYQQELLAEIVFHQPISMAIANLIQKKQLADGESFKCSILIRDRGLPTIDPELVPKLTTTTGHESPPHSGSQEQPEKTKRNFTISVKGRQPLVIPVRKNPASYPKVEAIREVKPGFLRVFMERGASDRLHEAVKSSSELQVEVAGALVGGVFTDENNETFVEVNDILPSPQAQGDFYQVRINEEAWRSLIETVNTKYGQDKVLVGWYHTHLISKLNMTPGSVGGEMQASRQTFVSVDDVYIHDNYFPQPWHVALVVDLSIGQDVFFYRREKALVDCGGFFLFGATGQE